MLPPNPSIVDRQPNRVLTVSALSSQIKDVVESNFGVVWVNGEISNFRKHRSGHIYLTLKDDWAQISAVIWRAVAVGCPSIYLMD